MKRTHSVPDLTGVAAILVVLSILRIGAQSAPGTVVDNGPHGIRDPGSTGRSPFAGAINAVVPHPTNPDILWIGAVNGGVWKTTTATQASPHWVPLTDHQASLSIGALALDPTIAAANVLVAGIGGGSSFGVNGPATGLLRTADGGGTWTSLGKADLGGETITGVAPRGDVIVVASRTGLWRSHDGGSNFNQLGPGNTAGGSDRVLLKIPVTDLVGDPVNNVLLYAAMPGIVGGVFLSEDTGHLWRDVSIGGTFGQPGGTDFVSGAKRVSLSVHDDGRHEVVYAGVLDADQAKAFVFRSADRGASWTRMDNADILNGDDIRFMSMQADPTSPTIVYIGGDGLGGPGGLIVRCDAALPRLLQCESLAREKTLNNSAPHGDSRALSFDALGTLLDASDGGISRRWVPRAATGFWTALDGDLSVIEAHSCAWDHVGHVAICGTQDNGVGQQNASGAAVWTNVHGGDGGVVAVSEAPGVSLRYYSASKLNGFTGELCFGLVCSTFTPSLTVLETLLPLNSNTDSTMPFYTPIAAHPLNPARLVIASDFVYESDNAGQTLRRLAGFNGSSKSSRQSIAFGSTDHPNYLYVGSTEGLFRHTAKFAPMTKLASYPGSTPQSVRVIPGFSNNVLVADSGKVWITPDGGSHWLDLTFDLRTGAGADDFHTVAFVLGTSGNFALFVGASDGLYAMTAASFGHWFKIHGKLPNAVVHDLDYDSTDDILLVATIGRGTWTIANPGNIELPAN
jgi:hypothetical protein